MELQGSYFKKKTKDDIRIAQKKNYQYFVLHSNKQVNGVIKSVQFPAIIRESSLTQLDYSFCTLGVYVIALLLREKCIITSINVRNLFEYLYMYQFVTNKVIHMKHEFQIIFFSFGIINFFSRKSYTVRLVYFWFYVCLMQFFPICESVKYIF